ncbi:hypothetical protein Moror_2703 [Moniliophthora roreri MCA 2997]|uniref:Uncharacterized protein n=1 Tax=Moniliophthora roreri (strain MCA 2997) TaxID=1381753 RepID=V2XFY7_MONRO|nr:hypothetical protein Moror_2703 [Moniliophthora roreri MCA 2997]
MSTRPNYRGLRRKLVVAFDIGTTFSGASFAVLDPGLPPLAVIEGVTSFPGQLNTRGDSKIPSIICYDEYREVCAAGSEATDEAFLDLAEDRGLTTIEWFKLHLRPKHLPSSHVNDSDIPTLPLNKTPIDVFADFLRYTHTCATDYIKNNRGPQFWSTVEDDIDYVLTHPNGWEGLQQSQMRQAAIQAGLINVHDPESRLQFVTEGEASLHYCISKGAMNEAKMHDRGVIIVDAGGGTIDLSAYAKTASGGFEEMVPAQCRLQGSVYVTRRAEVYLRDRLKGSRYGNDQDITHITSVFDKSTKHLFRDDSSISYIRFGSARDKDPEVDIKGGQMKISGEVMKKFFAPCIDEIVEAISEQQKQSHIPIVSILLVGGFAASDWLFSNLEKALADMGLTLSRPDGFVNKAVAEGAVSFYLDHCVTTRVSRFNYGVRFKVRFNSADPEHQKRAFATYVQPDGQTYISGLFDVILPKGSRVEEETEFRQGYSRQSFERESLENMRTEILCYRGKSKEARIWRDSEPNMFSTLCTIEADLRSSRCIRTRRSPFGQSYYYANYEIVLLFGLTELKAQICWKEGQEKRSSAIVVYDHVHTERR